MELEFAKMQGLGNDFVVVDRRLGGKVLDAAQMRHIANRKCGVGFDQLLILEPANDGADFAMSIFNADGTRAEQCGNGVRCLARYAARKGISTGSRFSIESSGRNIGVVLHDDGDVSCDMGVPLFAPQALPFEANREADWYDVETDSERVSIGAVSMGNPHAVIVCPAVDSAAVDRLGSAIEYHPRFAQRVNVGFMQIVDRRRIRLRVHERGVGETRACGTGACAAVAVGRHNGLLDDEVLVELAGGPLTISWGGDSESLWMRGPATWVFEGKIEV